ncbi:MAG: nitroreductase family protein [Bacteroidales bacterium]|nr:nitroreductase family protein [Bacteroidales bacterium]
MNLKTAIENRKSVRSFTQEEIPIEDVREMVRLAGYAPSIENYQPWKFIMITNKVLLDNMSNEIIKAIHAFPSRNSKIAENLRSQAAWYATFFEDAPVLLAVITQHHEEYLTKALEVPEGQLEIIRNYPGIQSVGACVQNFLLAATSMGYGACWLSGPMFAREKMEQLLKIDENHKLVTFIAMGKPNGENGF